MTPAPTLPSLQGQLSDTSIGELLALALERRLSGSVVLETPVRQKHVLVIEAGRLTKAQTAETPAPLRQLASARGSLEEQLALRLSWLCRLPLASTFRYHGNVDLLAHTPASNTEPLTLLWRSIRDAVVPHPRQRAVLASLAGSSLALSPEATPERFALSLDEQQLVDVLRAGALSLGALLSACAVEEERAQRLVYLLRLTRQLITRANEPSRGHVSSTSTVTPASQSRSEHPSLAPAQCRLEHALQRATRRARAEHGASGPAKAAQAFQAALSCVSRKRFEEAASFARVASDAEPGNPEYLALHAWLRMQAGALATPAQAAQIMGALDRAVLKARESVPIRFYRAQVLKRLGRDEEAFKDFRFVARREPNNLDAVREVRLHLMRVRNQQKVSGVFSKLFLR